LANNMSSDPLSVDRIGMAASGMNSRQNLTEIVACEG